MRGDARSAATVIPEAWRQPTAHPHSRPPGAARDRRQAPDRRCGHHPNTSAAHSAHRDRGRPGEYSRPISDSPRSRSQPRRNPARVQIPTRPPRLVPCECERRYHRRARSGAPAAAKLEAQGQPTRSRNRWASLGTRCGHTRLTAGLARDDVLDDPRFNRSTLSISNPTSEAAVSAAPISLAVWANARVNETVVCTTPTVARAIAGVERVEVSGLHAADPRARQRCRWQQPDACVGGVDVRRLELVSRRGAGRRWRETRVAGRFAG